MATWERAMLAWPNGERCERSRETLETARRLRRWQDAPERCANCGKRAVVVCAGQPFCGGCRTQRESRMMTTRAAGAITAGTSAIQATAEGGGVLAGYAIVFGERSVDLGGFVEIIRPSAVDRTVAEATDLRALWNHNSEVTIGRVRAGTLAIAKDARGLRVRIATPTWARGHVETVERRDVTGMSFAFMARDDAWSLDDRLPLREVFDMSMSEVSPVSFPAYPATTLGTGPEGSGRSVDFARKQLRVLLAR
jgi:HK97 family phage prohead protease